MEKLDRNKHYSLIQKFVNYGAKIFIALNPRLNVVKLFSTEIYK